MKDAKSLLDGLLGQLGGVGGAASGGGGVGGALDRAGGLAGRAKGAWDGQSGLAKGAIAGGLLGVLLGGKSTRRMAGSALKVGGAALIGGLAYKAWQDWQAGKSASAQPQTGPVELPAPEGTVFLPSDAGAADELATRLLRAMVAAAKADGHVTPAERRRIETQLQTLGLGTEAQALIGAELDAPLDVGTIAALARGPEEAAEIYAASLLVVDPDAPAEKGYLAMLAARLQLEPGLVEHLHAKAAALEA
ncbi:tellurite resistance TerB family protein [Szabonella alba]|uniref:Tellurite resistance TerB family protein n=1 Tax=Szabonella alba TaxID=2804194 RepID=A0A8K0V9E7_9RHOB|nr:tellurite resistance TerB family protein [Szabonella alba]MBL4916093.1 tellurite resistance TerB family protein [Szabonella alba]